MVGQKGSSRFVIHTRPFGARITLSGLVFVLANCGLVWSNVYHEDTTPPCSSEEMLSLWSPLCLRGASAAELPPNSISAVAAAEPAKLESPTNEASVNEKAEAGPPRCTMCISLLRTASSLFSFVKHNFQRYGHADPAETSQQLGEGEYLQGGSLRGLQAGISNNQNQKSSKFNITLWVVLVMVIILALAIYATLDIAKSRDRLLYTKMRPHTTR
eukprot:GHVS01064981.1.p1 GENE.GHVS01064981.1~~GHVS01064981.1.p1  ORF type:complete len:215 (+),score=15.12 GHVS01064981.1:47-691(+)